MKYFFYVLDAVIRSLEGHKGSVSRIGILKNGNLVSGGSYDQTIKTWNSNNGSLLKTSQFIYDTKSFVVLNNGYLAIILSSSYTAYLSIYDVNNNIEISSIYDYTLYLTSIALLKNSYLALGTKSGYIYFGNSNDGSNIKYFSAHSASVASLLVLENGLLVSSSQDGITKIWNLTLISNYDLKQTLVNPTFAVSLAELKNGYLACGLDDGRIKIWNIINGQEIRTLTGHSGSVNALVANGNDYLFSGGADETIKIWNTNDGSLINTLLGHNGPVLSLIFLLDGSLASGSGDKTIKIWNKVS